jgi:rod shape determining protein RodA
MIERSPLTVIAARWVRRLQINPKLDWLFLALIVIVFGLGLIVLYSAANPHGVDQQVLDPVIKQSVRFALGMAVLLVAARIQPQYLRAWSPWLYGISLALLLAVTAFGEGKGAHRWLDLGILRFQPSELMKLGLPMMLAWYLHSRVLPPTAKDLCVCAVLILIPFLLIAEQPDLGTALLVAVSGVFVVFLAGISWRWIMGLSAASIAGLPILWHFMHEYQRTRVRVLIDPQADPLGTGWNIIQSKIAVGSGGLFGKGWLKGTQSGLDFLPEHHTDFIGAVLAEEFGFIGVAVLLILYLAIIARGLKIAADARETYSRLLAGSIAMTFFVYVVVNGGMISGLLPVVGVPLPLVSFGGTALVTMLTSFGILMSIHAHRSNKNRW